MRTYDGTGGGAIGEQRNWNMHLSSTGSGNTVHESKRAEWSLEINQLWLINLVLHSRISLQDARITEALVCHFSFTARVVTVNCLHEVTIRLWCDLGGIVTARPAK
jgi:hypothetical protein